MLGIGHGFTGSKYICPMPNGEKTKRRKKNKQAKLSRKQNRSNK